MTALFKTHSRNHGLIAQRTHLPEQVVGAAMARLFKKGYVRMCHGALEVMRTTKGAPLQRLTVAEQQAMIERAVKQGKITKCDGAEAFGALRFKAFGGRWFSS